LKGVRQMTAITVRYTTRTNGLGKDIKGWYVIRFGLPVGCAYTSKSQAIKSAGLFLADTRSQLSV
jgi:hypothetical protein